MLTIEQVQKCSETKEYTYQDVAGLYQVCIETVRNWVKGGRIAAKKRSRKIHRITGKAILAFEKKTESPAL